MMEKARKPSDFLATRRKAIIEKALERRKKAAKERPQQDRIVGPWSPFTQKPLTPTTSR
jgi:hypothetical protein